MAVVTPIHKVKSLGEVTNLSSTFIVYHPYDPYLCEELNQTSLYYSHLTIICNKRIDFSLSTVNREISHLRNQYVVTCDTVKEKEYVYYHRLMCKKENF